MFSGIRYFEFLSKPEFSNDFDESCISFINCSAEIIVFRGEKRIEYENRVRGSFTNCCFWSIKVSSERSKIMCFFFILQTL